MTERLQEPTFWAAPELARAGYPVFPLAGKVPAVAGGFYAATTDVSEIAAWIEDGHGDHDIGIATGHASGVVVIEADSPRRRAEMEKRFGPPTVVSRNGGHWYFKHPRDGKVVSRNIVPDLDSKADGGYVAAPPSTGKSWTNGIPDKKALPELPEKLREELRPGTNGTSTNGHASHDVGDLEQLEAATVVARHVKDLKHGERHEHLKHLCGVLLSRGVSQASAAAILMKAWQLVGGELGDRAPREVPNTLRTTADAIADGRATGVPSLEKLTPGLFGELERILSRDDPVLVEGGPETSFSSSHSPIGNGSDDENKTEETGGPEIVWFSELGEPKEREFLIEHVGVKGYPLVVYGAGGVAKSFATLAAGIVIASTETAEWLGLRILEHGHVLYLDFELDVDEQHRRVRDLCAGLGVMVPKRLAYLSGVGLAPTAAFEAARKFVKEYEAKAVIVDSMGLAMASGDMDRGKDVISFHTQFINPLRRAGATPILVDHEGKLQAGEKRKDKAPTGSAYKTWLGRNVLPFILDEYDQERSTLTVQVRQHKTNFTPLTPFGAKFTFGAKKVSMERFELSDDELLEEIVLPVAERILAALKHEDKTVTELKLLTGATEGTLYNNLARLVKGEQVMEKGYRGRAKLYGLFSSSPQEPKGELNDENEDGELF